VLGQPDNELVTRISGLLLTAIPVQLMTDAVREFIYVKASDRPPAQDAAMRVPLARSPPAWRIACRKGPESALIDDVLCQRRFVQHRRLEVDLGCSSCHRHPAFLRGCRVRRSAPWLLPASRRCQ
jgi:hypothetical protein